MFREILFILVLTSIFFSCKSREAYPMESFFTELEHSVSTDQLTAFKNAPEDSAVFYFRKFYSNFQKIYDKPDQIKALNIFFDSVRLQSRIEYLCFAFHSKLNNKDFDNNEIKKNAFEEYLRENAKWENELKRLDLENYHIMQTNDKKWKVGNLIKIVLPVEFNKDGTKSARYYNNYYASLDPFGFDDSLKINANILEKRYSFPDDSLKTDTAHIIFKLKITKLSNPNYKIFYEKFEVGDTLDLYLKAYCRYIH